MPNRLTSKARARIINGREDSLFGLLPRLRGAAALSMVMGQCWLSVRLLCSIDYHPSKVIKGLSAVATRCRVTSEAGQPRLAFNGDDQGAIRVGFLCGCCVGVLPQALGCCAKRNL